MSSAADDARCTIVIPARDAAETIVETLTSVRAQTLSAWQAVVVDDGSTDDTAAIVQRIASEDRRVRMIAGPQHGVGAARNAGIRAAATPFINFLDADDLLLPTFLERMLPPLENDGGVAATYTGWQRLSSGGTTEDGPCPTIDGDLFGQFAAACVFPPLACVVRRGLVEQIDGFDEAPTTTEDWDFWQRLARTGARFVRVPGSLVTYRMRFGSRSRDSRRVLDDGLAVIARGHAPDSRVRNPHPSHAMGAEPARLSRALYNHLSWAIGVAMMSGDEPAPLLDRVVGHRAPDLDPWEVGGTLLEAMRVTMCASPGDGVALIVRTADALVESLAAIESASGAHDLALRTVRAIEHLACQKARAQYPRTLIASHEISIDLARPIEEVTDLPARVDRLHVHLAYDRDPLGDIELAVCDGNVRSPFIADAAADAIAWPLLERFFARTFWPTLDLEHAGDRVVVRRHGVVIGDLTGTEKPSDATLFAAIGWTVLIQELFGTFDRPLGDMYKERISAIEPPQPLAAPWLEADLSQPIREIHTTAMSVLVRSTIGGALFGDIDVPVSGGTLSVESIRRAMTDTEPDELVRVVAREAIIGWRVDDSASLRARLAQRFAESVTRKRRALPGGGIAMLRSVGASIGGPPASLVSLPIAARSSIERLARTTHRPVVSAAPTSAGNGAGAAYLPDIAETLPVRAAHTSFVTPAAIAEHGTSGFEDRLLVLAYDRLGTGEPASAGGRQLHPREFDEQLAWLHENGYRSLSAAELRHAIEKGSPAPQRRVLITFDGGYSDFVEEAWPALMRRGFTALVFVVTGSIGGSPVGNAPAPTMDWATIRALQAEGVAFGSNTVTHPWLTGRPPESMVAELFDSRSEIEQQLGTSIECLAYPFGAEDRAVRRLAGAAGYLMAMTRQSGRWTHKTERLAVPRHVVTGHMSLDDFARMCGGRMAR